MAFLVDMERIEEVFDLPRFTPHLLTGDRAGTYSVRVSANWRITFRYDADGGDFYDVDYDDYH